MMLHKQQGYATTTIILLAAYSSVWASLTAHSTAGNTGCEVMDVMDTRDEVDFKGMHNHIIVRNGHKLAAKKFNGFTLVSENETVLLHNWFYEYNPSMKEKGHLDVDERAFVPFNNTCAECFWVSNLWPGVAGIFLKKATGMKIAGMSWQSRLPPQFFDGKLDIKNYQPQRFTVWISGYRDCERLKFNTVLSPQKKHKWNEYGYKVLWELEPKTDLAVPFESGYDYRKVEFNDPETFPGQTLDKWQCILIDLNHEKEYGGGRISMDEFVLLRNVQFFFDMSSCGPDAFRIPNICDGKTCNDRGECVESEEDYTCQCDPKSGFEGQNCEINIDDCAGKTCSGVGKCKDVINNYMCHCDKGFTGKNCEKNIDDCAGKTCSGVGRCEDGVNDYSCKCDEGYAGKNCEKDIDGCDSQSCSGRGQCHDQGNDYRCDCNSGFFGKNCEDDLRNAKVVVGYVHVDLTTLASQLDQKLLTVENQCTAFHEALKRTDEYLSNLEPINDQNTASMQNDDIFA